LVQHSQGPTTFKGVSKQNSDIAAIGGVKSDDGKRSGGMTLALHVDG
jgi:hypothetical protein